MNRFGKSSNSGINIGSSSLLMIFVVLCLVSFATLSIVSANADRKLSAKVLEHTQAYYDACSQAENKLAQIDQSLVSIYEQSDSEDDYFKTAGHSIKFALPVTDLHTLSIELEIIYPGSSEDSFYRIISYKLETTGSLELDETLPVFE